MIKMKTVKKLCLILSLILLASAASTIPPPLGVLTLSPGLTVIPGNAGFKTTLAWNVTNPGYIPAAYEFAIRFDPLVMNVYRGEGLNGVKPGADGFVTTVNHPQPGIVTIAGSKAGGLPQGNHPDFLTICWNAAAEGYSPVTISITALTDAAGNAISGYAFGPARVITLAPVTGDANNDRKVDIVDALMTAQYSTGLSPGGFNSAAADVDNSGTAGIVDALMIARYSTGLVTEFPAGKPVIRYVLDLDPIISTTLTDPELVNLDVGTVTITPPGETVYSAAYRIYEKGSAVTLTSAAAFSFSGRFPYLFEFMQWNNITSGQTLTELSAGVVMDRDIQLAVYYRATMPGA